MGTTIGKDLKLQQQIKLPPKVDLPKTETLPESKEVFIASGSQEVEKTLPQPEKTEVAETKEKKKTKGTSFFKKHAGLTKTMMFGLAAASLFPALTGCSNDVSSTAPPPVAAAVQEVNVTTTVPVEAAVVPQVETSAIQPVDVNAIQMNYPNLRWDIGQAPVERLRFLQGMTSDVQGKLLTVLRQDYPDATAKQQAMYEMNTLTSLIQATDPQYPPIQMSQSLIYNTWNGRYAYTNVSAHYEDEYENDALYSDAAGSARDIMEIANQSLSTPGSSDQKEVRGKGKIWSKDSVTKRVMDEFNDIQSSLGGMTANAQETRSYGNRIHTTVYVDSDDRYYDLGYYHWGSTGGNYFLNPMPIGYSHTTYYYHDNYANNSYYHVTNYGWDGGAKTHTPTSGYHYDSNYYSGAKTHNMAPVAPKEAGKNSSTITGVKGGNVQGYTRDQGKSGSPVVEKGTSQAQGYTRDQGKKDAGKGSVPVAGEKSGQVQGYKQKSQEPAKEAPKQQTTGQAQGYSRVKVEEKKQEPVKETPKQQPPLAPSTNYQRKETPPAPVTTTPNYQRKETPPAPAPSTSNQRKETPPAPAPSTSYQRKETPPAPSTSYQRKETPPAPSTNYQRRDTSSSPSRQDYGKSSSSSYGGGGSQVKGGGQGYTRK